MNITPRSTPIIWFGDYANSKVCTISLNPSDREFYNKPKDQIDYVKPENLLKDKDERLCSREKLGKDDDQSLDDNDIKIIKDYCNNYFNNANYYKEWFDPLNNFLEEFGNYSFFNGSCVNLDIIQWATTPKWKGLSSINKEKLLKKDLNVLKFLLENKTFDIMFLNGKSVIKIVSDYLKIKLIYKSLSYKNNKNKEKKITIFSGMYNKTKVIGWNLYFQYTFKNISNIKVFCDLIKNNIL